MEQYANMTWEEIRRLIEERRRKQVQAFILYGRIFAEQAQERAKGEAELAALREKLDHWENCFSEFLKSSYETNVKMLNELEKQKKNVADFFREEDPAAQERREFLLKNTNVDEEGFGHLALAACAKIKNGAKAVLSIFRGKKEPKELLEIAKKEGKAAGQKALEAFAAGEKAELEEMIREGLRMGCYEFSQTKDPMEAMMWSRHVNGFLEILHTHEMLLNDPADEKLLEDAHGVSAMGKMMENGLEALKTLQEAQLNGTDLPEAQKAELTARILLMQEENGRRISEETRKQRANDFNAKKRLDPERMSQLLEKMSKSDTVRRMAGLDFRNLVFCLSDSESRSSLSARMFREKGMQFMAPGCKPPEPAAPTMNRR